MQIEFPNLQGIYWLLHYEGMISWRLEWGTSWTLKIWPLNSDESSLPIRHNHSTPSEAALLLLYEAINPPTLAEETVRTLTWGSCHARFLPLLRTSYLPIYPQLSNISSVSSAQFSHSVVSDSLQPHESQHTKPPCPSPTPGVYSNSGPSSQWCHPANSSSAVAFSSCPQSLSASGSSQISQFFTSGGQSIGVSASASVLPMTIQDYFL